MTAQLKLYAAAGLLLGMIALGWYLHHSGYKAGEAASEARMQALVEQANAKATQTETAAETHARAIEAAYEAEKVDLTNRYRSALAKYERLRASARGSSQVPQAAGNAPVDPGHPVGGGHAGADDSDPGPALILYAKDAEQLRLALNACKRYGAEIKALRAQIPD